MAKGKHATALFEVIHASKQFGGKGGKEKAAGLLRTPKWWFKGRQQQAEDPTTRPLTAGPASAPAASTAPVAAAEEETRAAEADAAAPVTPESLNRDESQDPALAPAPAPAPARVPADPTANVAIARPPAVDVLVDPNHHRITFRVTYTSAVVTCFTIAVVVALAYLVGRHMARGPAAAMGGPSTEQVRQSPPRPDVMDVSSGRGATGRTSEPEEGTTSVSPPGARSTQPRQSAPAPRTGSRRVSGLNYVIIQGYPDEASAKAAVDILRQNGVDATIEKGLRGMKSDWFIVVGTQGFSRVSSPEFEQYLRKIKAISDKFVGKRSFKAFEPMGYRWDRP